MGIIGRDASRPSVRTIATLSLPLARCPLSSPPPRPAGRNCSPRPASTSTSFRPTWTRRRCRASRRARMRCAWRGQRPSTSRGSVADRQGRPRRRYRRGRGRTVDGEARRRRPTPNRCCGRSRACVHEVHTAVVVRRGPSAQLEEVVTTRGPLHPAHATRRSPGTSSTGEADGKAGRLRRFRAARRGSSTASTGRGRTSSGCRSRRSTGCCRRLVPGIRQCRRTRLTVPSGKRYSGLDLGRHTQRERAES